MMQISVPKLIAITSLGLTLIACPFKKDEMKSIGPDVKADLVIYFNIGVSEQAINSFWQEVLSRPHPQGKGYNHRDGVGSISRIFPAVQGHEGISLSFFPQATQAQRDELEREIKSSPVVYKILKNTAPITVKKLD
jgi:hypothetical protein